MAIGPSICRSCYEVSEDVIEQFLAEFSEGLWEKLYDIKENGKYQLDLWEANRQILLEAGVSQERILTPGLCTCCNPSFCFHRASKGQEGIWRLFLELHSWRINRNKFSYISVTKFYRSYEKTRSLFGVPRFSIFRGVNGGLC